MTPTPLERWLESEAEREARTVFLEEALLTGRFARYALYRLRYFLLRYFAESVLHAAKFVILFIAFEGWFFTAVVLVSAGAGLVTSFWWGALEVMRARVRTLARSGRPRRIPAEIGGWLSLSMVIGGLCLLATFAWIAVSIGARAQPLHVFHLYVGAVGLRLALDLGTLTFHSGAYAIRRIYRPLPALLAVEAVGLVAMGVAWPFLGHWSIPAAMMVSALVSSALTVHYTARLYRFLLWLPLPLSSSPRFFIRRIRRIAAREFLAAGTSYALMRLDSFLVLALFTAGRHEVHPGDLFLLFYVLSPTVRAGFDWAQLFYFDLKRLEVARFQNLRARYERFLERMAFVLGVLFGVVACFTGFLLLGWSLGLAAPLLAPFFVSRSSLGLAQIRAFATRRYGRLLVSGAGLLVGVAATAAFLAPGWAKLLGLTTVTMLLLAWLWREGGKWSDDDEQRVLPPLDWIRALGFETGPVRIREGQLSPSRSRTEDDPESEWAVQRAAERIGRRIGRRGAVTKFGSDRVVWFERDRQGSGRVTTEWLLEMGAGLWQSLGSATAFANGREAWQAAHGGGRFLFGGSTETGDHDPDGTRLERSFRKLHPRGLVYAPENPLPAWLTRLPSRDRRALLKDAEYFVEHLRPRPGRGRFEVTALCTDRNLKLVFLAPRPGNSRRRARWESQIRAANLAATLDADGEEALA